METQFDYQSSDGTQRLRMIYIHRYSLRMVYAVVAESKYDRWGGRGTGIRACEAADYLRKASACKGQKLGGLKPPSPTGSVALGICL